MTSMVDTEVERIAVTDGDIAVVNLQSARQRSWNRFWRAPEQSGIAELIVEQEQLTAQFVGDLSAFDRLEMLANELAHMEPESGRSSLVAAQVGCSTHRFVEARTHVTRALAHGVPEESSERLLLTIDQATGANLSVVLATRRDRADRPGHWDERVPLGALLADLGEFDEADRTYRDALRTYPDVSPFSPAWVCFQLGVLWGESVPTPDLDRAAKWYEAAISYLPCYVKARVHLAEIHLDQHRTDDATALLAPAIESGDPEVSWRLADVADAMGNAAEAARHLAVARSGFEALVAKHPLAFADHAAEFYLGSGNDPVRALELARLDLSNRPTLRAFEQAHSAAAAAGEAEVAARLREDAQERWGSNAVFQSSPLMDLTQQRGEARART
jgi:tetratricopeptide (TPR) repeat protein